MEKAISSEERIRRAQEIYLRRRENNNYVRMSGSQVRDGKEKRQFSLYKKMILQILICILIYLIFSLIKQANYIFSEQVLNQTKDFLSQDINFQVIVDNVGQFFQNNKDKLDFLSGWLKDDNNNEQGEVKKQNENNEQENKNEVVEQNKENNKEGNESKENNEKTNSENNKQNNNEKSNTQNNNENTDNKNTTDEAKSSNTEKTNTIDDNNLTGMGGASNNETTALVNAKSSSNSNSTATSNSSSSSNVNKNNNQKTQMEQDAEYIKANFKIGIPVKGTITSRYGTREATKIVTAEHYGIDIAVNVGTTIVAAMEGKVSLVSNEGEYGTHVKIVNKDVTTIYAHCSKILVKEGDTVKKGQKIALSGNTGRTTGPHLHFEIRRDNRTVNPELVVKF